MSSSDKLVVWLHGQVKTPPFSLAARVEAGILLRRVQHGEILSMPKSRPMPQVGPRCHELRVTDDRKSWRIVYRVDADAILVVDVFAKTTQRTQHAILGACRRRLRQYDEMMREN